MLQTSRSQRAFLFRCLAAGSFSLFFPSPHSHSSPYVYTILSLLFLLTFLFVILSISYSLFFFFSHCTRVKPSRLLLRDFDWLPITQIFLLLHRHVNKQQKCVLKYANRFLALYVYCRAMVQSARSSLLRPCA